MKETLELINQMRVDEVIGLVGTSHLTTAHCAAGN
jgi:hypothetical protein